MSIYRDKLIEMVDLAEKQIRVIRLVTGFPDAILSPQLQIIREAKELLEEADQ